MKNLESNLNVLIKQLSNLVSESRRRLQVSVGRNIPKIIENFVWASQTISRVNEITKFSTFISDKTILKPFLDLDVEVKSYRDELFKNWVNETESELDDPKGILSLDQKNRLMEIDYSDGKLIVNYSDKLVVLMRQTRQFISFGFPVSFKIKKAAEIAMKYYRHAIVLKQVAHFYNTIDQQMLPCQQSMLLDLALEFERLVKNPKGDSNSGISWDSTSDLEGYISKLQESAEKLTSMNRKLRKYHDSITDYVIQMMNIDLVKNSAKFKECLNNIRIIINIVQTNGVKTEDTLPWRNYWDYQLYKAFEIQYRFGLETINENLAEIKVEIVFKSGKLFFRPPFEEIRAKYYREMKKFINIPNSFVGLGNCELFSRMIDNNDKSLLIVYRKAEVLFQNLLKTLDVFKPWVVLGTVDIDEFVEQALVDVSDWELNFRNLKLKGKEAEQLPTQLQVDCIAVSTGPVKATIDDQLQALMDSMLSALRKSVNKHMAFIENFATKGMLVLSKRPQSLAEIGEANNLHGEISKSKGLIQSHFNDSEVKNKLLKSVCGSGVDISQMQAKWNKLELVLAGHELMIKEQMDVFRNSMNSRVQSAQSDINKFVARWKQLKPKVDDIKSSESALKAIGFILEKRSELEVILKIVSQIVEDSTLFGLESPEFNDLDDVKQDISVSEDTWGSLSVWIQSIGNILKEDWISFRSKLHILEDLLNEWTAKIQSQQMTHILAHIQKEIDLYKKALPSLKLVKGECWTADHWGELFHLISIPKGVFLSELNVGQFLIASEKMAIKIAEIKEINNRALGEVSIREAMQELDIWGASAIFSLTDYITSYGSRINLIKDWKETLTQLGDNQSLLQSLKESPYFKNFADKVSSWDSKLSELDEALRNLNTVQRKWVYLEPIFGKGALPAEEGRFHRIDEDFRSIMSRVSGDSRVMTLLTISNLQNTLLTLVDQLERCQKALNDFLEQKRSKFARFYFLGDEDLLEILGQAKNPNVIQSHLKKLFAGVYYVAFDSSMTSIIAMKSIEGEVVVLNSPVKITEDVEIWLHHFAEEMKVTLNILLKKCLTSSDILAFPSQILGLAEALHFTSKCETAISNGSLSKVSEDLKLQLGKFTSFDYQSIENASDRKVADLKIKSLILDIWHQIDVVKQLQDSKVTSVTDWTWQRQLRFYMKKDNVCVVRMYDAEFLYTYEYQGNPAKLVHTTLTDKCYLTLTQAMRSGFGGNPFGPAGTGKTESVKALGSLLSNLGVLMGRQTLVFNCDEGIDYKSMGRIFVGLVNCGAWGWYFILTQL